MDIISLLGDSSEAKRVPTSLSADTSQTLHHLLFDYFLHNELMRGSSLREDLNHISSGSSDKSVSLGGSSITSASSGQSAIQQGSNVEE